MQILDDSGARLEAVESRVSADGYLVAAYAGIRSDDRRHGQRVANADFVIDRIVRRRDLDCAGSEVGVDCLIGNDWNLAFEQRR